jgi:hypothetical protein
LYLAPQGVAKVQVPQLQFRNALRQITPTPFAQLLFTQMCQGKGTHILTIRRRYGLCQTFARHPQSTHCICPLSSSAALPAGGAIDTKQITVAAMPWSAEAVKALDVCATAQAPAPMITCQVMAMQAVETGLKQPMPCHFQAKHGPTQSNRAVELSVCANHVLNHVGHPMLDEPLPGSFNEA